MHKFDEKTYATLEITNAVGTSTAKFSLLPPASSMGVIIGVIVVTIIIILGIFIFTLTKVNKALCFKDQQSGESGKKTEDPEAQDLAPKEEKEKSTSKEKVTEWITYGTHFKMSIDCKLGVPLFGVGSGCLKCVGILIGNMWILNWLVSEF